MAFWICETQSVNEEQACLSQGFICCGDDAIAMNLNDYPQAKNLTFYLEDICGLDEHAATTLTAACWSFAYELQVGDIVILENIETTIWHLGTVVGIYECSDEGLGRLAQRRAVSWFSLTIDRSLLPQDLQTALHVYQERDLSRLTLEQEERLTTYLMACWQQRAPEGSVFNAGLTTITALSREQERAFLLRQALNPAPATISPERLVLMHLKIKLASGELNMADVVKCLIQAFGLMVTDVPESTAKTVTLVSSPQNNAAVKVLWQVRMVPLPLTLQVLDFMEGILPIYQCSRAILISLSGFDADITAAVKAGKTAFQVVLWGPEELARELISQKERLTPTLRQALEL